MNFQPDETLNIDTPENVVFGYSIAGIGSRFLAALIDTFLILALQLITFLPILFFIGLDSFTDDKLGQWVIALFSLLAFVFFWGYYIFFELSWNGQTPGKRTVGLRVVRSDGTPVTLFEVLVRNLVRIIDLLPTAYGVGVITMFVDGKSRRLGDLAASTLVVHEQKALSLEALAVTPNEPAAPVSTSNGFPVERLTNSDLQLIEDYLQRREQLPNNRTLALQIIKKLHDRVGIAEYEPPIHPDELLEAIASAAHNRARE